MGDNAASLKSQIQEKSWQMKATLLGNSKILEEKWKKIKQVGNLEDEIKKCKQQFRAVQLPATEITSRVFKNNRMLKHWKAAR